MTEKKVRGVLGILDDPRELAELQARSRMQGEVPRTPLSDDEVSARFTEGSAVLGDAACERSLRRTLETIYARQLSTQKPLNPATRRSYVSVFKQFAECCAGLGVRSLPARAGIVAAYLHLHVEDNASAETIRKLVAAIKWAHLTQGLPDPTQDDLVQAVVAFSRERPKPPSKINGAAHAELEEATA